MSERTYADSIDDIRRAVALIGEFTQGIVIEDFQNDEKTQFAVVRCFEIIGEAAKRIPREFADSHPGIPWKIMAGMRDRLIHGYDQIDIPLIWRTIVNDIPSLSRKLKEL